MLIKIFGKIPSVIFEDEKTNSVSIPYYTILQRLGARFHPDPIRDCYDYRFAKFTIFSSSTPLTSRKYLEIPIPFKKHDLSIGIRNYG